MDKRNEITSTQSGKRLDAFQKPAGECAFELSALTDRLEGFVIEEHGRKFLKAGTSISNERREAVANSVCQIRAALQEKADAVEVGGKVQILMASLKSQAEADPKVVMQAFRIGLDGVSVHGLKEATTRFLNGGAWYLLNGKRVECPPAFMPTCAELRCVIEQVEGELRGAANKADRLFNLPEQETPVSDKIKAERVQEILKKYCEKA